MESSTLLEGDDVDRVINGTVFDDDIVLEADTPGHLKVTFQGLTFFNGLGYDHSLSFVNPSTSLTIEAGSGGDTITVKSLDPAFAADLLLYGNKAGAPTIEPDAGQDVVRFQGDVYTARRLPRGLRRRDLRRRRQDAVSTLDRPGRTTSAPATTSSFRARRIGTTEIENLLPSGYLTKTVEIDIGAGATMLGSSIYLIAQAEDRALAEHARPHDARVAVLPRPGGELPAGPDRAADQGAGQGLRGDGHDPRPARSCWPTTSSASTRRPAPTRARRPRASSSASATRRPTRRRRSRSRTAC